MTLRLHQKGEIENSFLFVRIIFSTLHQIGYSPELQSPVFKRSGSRLIHEKFHLLTVVIYKNKFNLILYYLKIPNSSNIESIRLTVPIVGEATTEIDCPCFPIRVLYRRPIIIQTNLCCTSCSS